MCECVCVYVCMCACMHAWMHVCVHTCMCVCMHVCVCVHKRHFHIINVSLSPQSNQVPCILHKDKEGQPGTKAYVDPYQRPGCDSNWLAPWPRAGDCGFTWLPWENHPQVASNNYTNNFTCLTICSPIIARDLQHLSNYCTMCLNNWQVKLKHPPPAHNAVSD